MMGKTRIEELCYELYGSSKQHDSWQRYAMVRELRELMKRPKASGSDHFERSGEDRRFGGDDRRFGGGQFREGADDDDETDLLWKKENPWTEMAKTRSQEDDPVPQWLLRYEEATTFADWRVSMKQKEQRSNQRSDDQSTLDRSSAPSLKANLEEKSTSHFQFGEGADDDEEQYLVMDEELAETEVATELNGIEDRAVENEANSKVISVIVKEESIPQILMVTEADSTCVQQQVSISPLEHSLNFCKANLAVMGNCQYAMGKTHQIWSDSNFGCVNDDACQVFDEIPLRKRIVPKEHKKRFHKCWRFKFKDRVASRESKAGFEVNMKHNQSKEMLLQMLLSGTHKKRQRKTPKYHKAWKFKFKPTSKRSRLMDDKFSFVDATVLLNKDPKETIWDCVKKELKETMAACEKNRVDRFKLAEEKESKLQVLDLHQTFRCHQIGRVWEPGGLPNKMDLWDWFETELKACGESQQVERFLYSLMQVVKRNLEFKTFESNKTFSDSDIASFIGLGGYNLIATYLENKKTWMFKYKAPNLDTKNCPHHYMVLLLASVAYDAQFPIGVGMNTKQLRLSLRNNRVWDPGGCISGFSRFCEAKVALLEAPLEEVSSFSNLEVKVSSNEGDLLQVYWTWAGSRPIFSYDGP